MPRGQAVGQQEAVLEALVDFEREISVVAARSVAGEFVHFGAIENQHVNGILDISIAPARVAPSSWREERLRLRERCWRSWK